MLHETDLVNSIVHIFLNQVCANLRLARVWFLKILIVPVRMCVCVCVCALVCARVCVCLCVVCVCVSLPPKLLLTSGVIWRDMDPK